MQITHALARAVTVPALAAVLTVGAVGPVHGDQGKGMDRAAAATSAAAERKAVRNAGKDANKGQRRNAAGPAKAQGGRPESKPARPANARGGKPDSRASRQDPRGHGHTPVTVCHLRGNGTYIEITFDENAFGAHTNHGDLHPVPDGGCPATAAEESDLEQSAVPGPTTPPTLASRPTPRSRASTPRPLLARTRSSGSRQRPTPSQRPARPARPVLRRTPPRASCPTRVRASSVRHCSRVSACWPPVPRPSPADVLG